MHYNFRKMNWIYEPWPWYVAGPMITFIMFLLIMVDKTFGMSSNLSTLCNLFGAGKISNIFKFDWKTKKWNLIIVLGAIIGGFIAANFMTNDLAVNINPSTIQDLHALGFESAGKNYLPTELFSNHIFTNVKSIAILAVAGLLVGFGARYAGGCTSGHAISGLSNLQAPSLLAVIGFFAGGLTMIYFIFPLIF